MFNSFYNRTYLFATADKKYKKVFKTIDTRIYQCYIMRNKNKKVSNENPQGRR